jgi:hypothetical protein
MLVFSKSRYSSAILLWLLANLSCHDHVEALASAIPPLLRGRQPLQPTKRNDDNLPQLNNHDQMILKSRRHLLAKSSSVIAAGSFLWATVAVPSAVALKPRNEQLCGTGFFTNIWEYRCTDIGDISDEGTKVGFSKGEQGAAESLMAKFQWNNDDVTVPEGESTSTATSSSITSTSSKGKAGNNIAPKESFKKNKRSADAPKEANK